MTPTSTDATLHERLEEAETELTASRKALREMSKVGMALMNERDPARLYDLILRQARSLTDSDAGSLYLVVEGEGEGDEQRLHFIAAQNDSLPGLPSPDFQLPFDETSIAGHVATSAQPLILADVYDLDEGAPYRFNRRYDEDNGYRAKSMLSVPMIDHRDNVVGVLQLINRKSEDDANIRTDEDAARWVVPYTQREVAIVKSFAGQAAVAIENRQLYQEIENLFAGFIKAAVTAIDQRDPTTSGHSVRVTELTCDMATLISRQTEGPFADIAFSDAEMKQLRYAGLLHDFGKVAVREATLVKEKKLPPVMGAQVEARFALIRKTLQLEAWEAKANVVTEKGPDAALDDLAAIDAELAEELDRVDRYWTAIEAADVPRVLDEDAAEILQEIAAVTFLDPDGRPQPYITARELHFLSIKRGSLDEQEREEIQAHVQHSYDFLLNIPWTEDLCRIAEIVRGHHEKLNGTGYPDGVNGDALCLETKIMTVCDIFDALTASDRPYKKAMPVAKALQILEWEANDGMLDPEVVRLFSTSGVYEKVLEKDWREF